MTYRFITDRCGREPRRVRRCTGCAWTHPDGDVGEVTQHRRRDEHVDARDGRHDDDLDLGASVADAVVDAHVQDVHRRFV